MKLLFALIFLFWTPFVCSNENSVDLLKQALFGQLPSETQQKELDHIFNKFIASQLCDPKPPFNTIGTRIYWEALEFPSLWQGLVSDFDREISYYVDTGIVSDDLRFTIAQIYFFGRLMQRPIYLNNNQGIDFEDKTLNYTKAIGPAAETAQFVRNSGAKKVCEVFSGRGNITLLLSLAGFEELITIEKDETLDLEASWQHAIDMMHRDIPSVFWPQITKPVFLSGDIFEIELPSTIDCVIMDPPYGYNYGTINEAIPFFLEVHNRLQMKLNTNIYSLIPAEWSQIIHLFFAQFSYKTIRESIDPILQESTYYQRKPEKWTGFMQAIQSDSYIKNIDQKIQMIHEISRMERTPVKNALGKELDIFQIYPK